MSKSTDRFDNFKAFYKGNRNRFEIYPRKRWDEFVAQDTSPNKFKFTVTAKPATDDNPAHDLIYIRWVKVSRFGSCSYSETFRLPHYTRYRVEGTAVSGVVFELMSKMQMLSPLVLPSLEAMLKLNPDCEGLSLYYILSPSGKVTHLNAKSFNGLMTVKSTAKDAGLLK